MQVRIVSLRELELHTAQKFRMFLRSAELVLSGIATIPASILLGTFERAGVFDKYVEVARRGSEVIVRAQDAGVEFEWTLRNPRWFIFYERTHGPPVVLPGIVLEDGRYRVEISLLESTREVVVTVTDKRSLSRVVSIVIADTE